ncbi:20S proteasome subunit beta 7, partial [Rhodotorula sp. JG-1b]
GKPRNDSGDAYATFPIHAGRTKPPTDAFSQGVQRTQQPIVTGTSVLGLKFKDGVMLAADCLASYGSLARFKDIRRLYKVSESTMIGASGDMADFQQVKHMLQGLMTDEIITEDGHELSTSQIFEYLSNVMYARRNKFDPYWNALLVAGVENGEPFLAHVDLLGVTYSSPSIATGFGMHLAQPLLRKALDDLGPDGEKSLSEDDARKILENAMRVLFYRDARSLNKFQIATVKADGVVIGEPQEAETSWSFAEGLRGCTSTTLPPLSL